MLNILVMTNHILNLSENTVAEVRRTAPRAEVAVTDASEVTMAQIRQADVIFGWPTREQLSQAENLKWLHLGSAGAEGYTDRKLYCREDAVLTNSSGVFGLPIAEHVFGMILNFNRSLDAYTRNKDLKRWERGSVRGDIYGSTVGILGFGDIGNEIAKRARAFGARVVAMKRTPGEKPEYVDALYGEEGVDAVLEQSDYVVLALPATAKTAGLVSEAKFRKMKRNALFVNIGRGALVDQEALVKALNEGWIAGAALDVTAPEPLPRNSPLWSMSNVIITPHVSGDSPSNELRRKQIFLSNLELFIQGKALKNRVNFEQGY